MPRTLVALLALLSSTACIIVRPLNDVGPIRDREETAQGMIVGHLEFPGHEIQGVLLYEDGTSYFAMEPRAPRAHVYANGDFVFENLKPVAWRLLCFYSGGRTYALMTHETKDDPRHRLDVRPGAVTFAGSFVVSEELAIARLDRPRFAEVLRGILPATRGTYWQRAVQERLAR